MLLRRVIEHVKDQNWLAVFLDFVIVVVGVFIGIQVANWNELRNERAATVDFEQRLEADLRNQLRNTMR
jgi:large-conductance mechanosensitive channel